MEVDQMLVWMHASHSCDRPFLYNNSPDKIKALPLSLRKECQVLQLTDFVDAIFITHMEDHWSDWCEIDLQINLFISLDNVATWSLRNIWICVQILHSVIRVCHYKSCDISHIIAFEFHSQVIHIFLVPYYLVHYNITVR